VEETRVVQVSPRHSVTVGPDYFGMIQRAPQQDFVVRTLAKRMAGDTPLMSGDLVIAGRATREQFPLAAAYPLHFRKTYYVGRLRGDPATEFARHTRASEILGIPAPIGHAGGTFRSCLLPGRPFDQVSAPFGSEPEESNIRHADNLNLAGAAGLWLLAERVMETLGRLHEAGLTHGDAHLHNFVVCSAPLDVLPIDFDMALQREDFSAEDWQARCEEDLEHLLRLAVYLQCGLGAQASPLGQKALARLDTLFTRAEPFRRAIEDRAAMLASLR
jgi:hypothetical protein